MKKYRIFWTCILPEHLIAQYRLSFAACNFSYNLMSGCAFDKVYSSMPLYVGGEMSKEAFSDKRFELIYDRWRKIQAKTGNIQRTVHYVPANTQGCISMVLQPKYT